MGGLDLPKPKNLETVFTRKYKNLAENVDKIDERLFQALYETFLDCRTAK